MNYIFEVANCRFELFPMMGHQECIIKFNLIHEGKLCFPLEFHEGDISRSRDTYKSYCMYRMVNKNGDKIKIRLDGIQISPSDWPGKININLNYNLFIKISSVIGRIVY